MGLRLLHPWLPFLRYLPGKNAPRVDGPDPVPFPNRTVNVEVALSAGAARSGEACAVLHVCSFNSGWLYVDAPSLCQAFLCVTRPTGFDCTRTSGLLARRKGR